MIAIGVMAVTELARHGANQVNAEAAHFLLVSKVAGQVVWTQFWRRARWNRLGLVGAGNEWP